MDNITGKLGDVGKMLLLSGGPWRRVVAQGVYQLLLSGVPWRRGVEQRVYQGLVVLEKGKFTTFQKKTEMADKGVGS